MSEKTLCSGIIIKGIGGFYYVKTGSLIVECHARGKFRLKEMSPMVGDYVSIDINDDGTGSIIEIKQRKNFLVRPGVANVDGMVIVSAAHSPIPDFFLTDKLLISAESKNIKSYICLNKTDLARKDDIADFSSVYEKAGYEVILACALTGEGIDRLESIVSGRTIAFAGLSGVGKSSLLRRLTGEKLETGSVSRINRGKHTTRHVELMEAGDGYVFDTPGFSRLETDEIKAYDLRNYFPEIRALEGQCKFDDCNHIREPGCAVIKALKNEGMAHSRHQSYITIFERLIEIKDWQRKNERK